jgi:hypothetical protein
MNLLRSMVRRVLPCLLTVAPAWVLLSGPTWAVIVAALWLVYLCLNLWWVQRLEAGPLNELGRRLGGLWWASRHVVPAVTFGCTAQVLADSWWCAASVAVASYLALAVRSELRAYRRQKAMRMSDGTAEPPTVRRGQGAARSKA